MKLFIDEFHNADWLKEMPQFSEEESIASEKIHSSESIPDYKRCGDFGPGENLEKESPRERRSQ